MRPRTRSRQARNRQAGSALLITIIGMFMLFGATVLVLSSTTNAVFLNRRLRASAAAFNIAESGADVAILWMKQQAIPPTGTTPIKPWGDTPVSLGEGGYKVTIVPDAGNATAFLRTYTIVSQGTVRGVQKTVQVVIRQASFGRYAYFTNKETSSAGGAIWWKAGEKVDGPVHSNNADNSKFQINYNGSSEPIFLDMVTSVASSFSYQPGTPSNQTTYKKIFKDGTQGYKLGVDYIPMPSSSDTQRNAAWGGTSGFPSTNGVYLRADNEGGIFIRGDAILEMRVNAAGDQEVLIKQGTSTTTLTLNRTTEGITTSGPMGSGSATSSSSLGTGVIYCTGNITSFKGTLADNMVVNNKIEVRNAFTIATDVNAGKSITIIGHIRYRTNPVKTQDSTYIDNLKAATLGLVAKDITIDDAAPSNLEIDAVCLAGGENTTGGSFSVENYGSKPASGNLSVLGGIIQKVRGAVGTFDQSSGTTSTGYAKNYSYDPRLATDPPPFFPTTGQYERLSWQIVSN